jgi:hypothetical protein
VRLLSISALLLRETGEEGLEHQRQRASLMTGSRQRAAVVDPGSIHVRFIQPD